MYFPWGIRQKQQDQKTKMYKKKQQIQQKMGYTKINNETKRQKGIRKKQQTQKAMGHKKKTTKPKDKLGFKKEKQKKPKDN